MSGGITRTVYIPDQSGEMVKRSLIAKYNEKEDEFFVKVPSYLVGDPLADTIKHAMKLGATQEEIIDQIRSGF